MVAIVAGTDLGSWARNLLYH